MPKPTIGPKTLIGPASLMDGNKRRIVQTTLNTSNTGAFSRVVFRAPDSGAKVTYVGVNGQVALYKDISGNWIFNAKNVSTTATLNAQAASLSDQSFSATSFKSIPVNNGNSTLGAGAVLQLQLTVSVAPQTQHNAL
jgi:hypothetical protein